jgi:hypothetical protein
MPSHCSQEKFRKAVKKALIEKDLTITAFALQIGFARNTVSMAINHPILPTVRRRIITELELTEVL